MLTTRITKLAVLWRDGCISAAGDWPIILSRTRYWSITTVSIVNQANKGYWQDRQSRAQPTIVNVWYLTDSRTNLDIFRSTALRRQPKVEKSTNNCGGGEPYG